MHRLVIEPPNSTWSEFVRSLIADLEPLGHSVGNTDDRCIAVTLSEVADRLETEWDGAHRARHALLFTENKVRILELEHLHADIFVQMNLFQPSTIEPKLEIVDFSDPRHQDIREYVGYCQSVRSKKLVGRRMGLFIWDHGQTGHRPLIGAAILASVGYSQRLRDSCFGWAPDFPKTSVHYDATARDVRVKGLDRMMQLSVACALPPYNVLSGAWLAALAPFTAMGQEAFARSVSQKAGSVFDPDLAAIVTTTGKGISGSPFRGHRLHQLSEDKIKIESAPGASGNLYMRVKPSEVIPNIRASFKGLISARTWNLARELGPAVSPGKISDHDLLEKLLRRSRLPLNIFDGNVMGIHVGMLGRDTLGHLAAGTPRPMDKRPRVSWDTAVSVWMRKFLPGSPGSPPSAHKETLEEHNKARREKHDLARAFPADRVKLSDRLSDGSETEADAE
jgi:hypothetical protein